MTHQPLGLSRWTRTALVSLFSLTLVTTFAMGSRPSYAEENPTSGVAEGAETTPSAETGEQGSEAFDTDSSDEENAPTQPSSEGYESSPGQDWEFHVNPVRNKTVGTVTITKFSELKTAQKADSVTVRSTLSYKDEVKRSHEEKKSLAELSDGKIDYDFENFGRHSVTVSFQKDGQTVHEATIRDIAVVADAYNIAPLPATLPVTFFSLNLWGEKSVRKQGPTIAMLERTNTYDWDHLPQPTNDEYGVYSLPFLTQDQVRNYPANHWTAFNNFHTYMDVMVDYVRELHELDPQSKFHVYTSDLYTSFVVKAIYANKIPQNNYTLTFLSDGTYSYNLFSWVYGGENPEATHQRAVEDWKALKARAQAGTADLSKVAYRMDYSTLWAAVDTEEHAKFWIGRKKLLISPKDNNVFATKVQNNSKVEQISFGNLLKTNITTSDSATQGLKKLYNFNDGYFADAKKENRKVMLILGTNLNNERNFSDYARLLKTYYGDEYMYYYKGHPATPTDLYPEKAQQLRDLGLKDVDASVAAELILFFNPDVDVAGYESTTFASVQQGHSKALFGITKADATAKQDSPYHGIDFWATPIAGAPQKARNFCPVGDTCYFVEVSDKQAQERHYEFAVWDASTSVFITLKKSGDGYEETGRLHGQDAPSALKSGAYVIQSALANDQVLDVYAGAGNDGANVQLYSFHGSNAQKWRVTFEAEGLATITNVSSGKVLDNSGGHVSAGTNVAQWTNGDKNWQKWRILPVGNGMVRIVSAMNPEIALDVFGGRAYNEANIGVWDVNGGLNQAFHMIPLPANVPAENQANIVEGYYTIASATNGGRGLDLAGYNADNGANYVLWDLRESENQVFKITKDSDGYYRIANAWSGRVLDSPGGSPIPGNPVIQWDSSAHKANQKWAIREKNNETYTLQNVGSGLMLDLRYGDPSNGQSIDVYVPTDSQGQKWMIKPVSSFAASGMDALARENRTALQDGVYTIRSHTNTAYGLDVYASSGADGANVQLYSISGGNNQKWRVSHDDKGYVTFTNIATGKVVDVFAARSDLGTNVAQYASTGGANQKWIVKVEKDGMKIISALSSSLVLDIQGGAVQNESNIGLWLDKASPWQRFIFQH